MNSHSKHVYRRIEEKQGEKVVVKVRADPPGVNREGERLDRDEALSVASEALERVEADEVQVVPCSCGGDALRGYADEHEDSLVRVRLTDRTAREGV